MERIRIGCASWNVPSRFADAAPTEGSHLQRYSRALDCMEINSTFRRRHKPETFRRWADAVPKEFRFAVKAPATVTHCGALDAAPLPEFGLDIEPLGKKLGPILFQLPPKLAFDGDAAARFFGAARELFDGQFACEPRHESWFTEDANELFAKHRVARVAADPSRARGGDLPAGWQEFRYYRLHGSPRTYYSEYSPEKLTALSVELLRSSVPTWCIFDNTASGAAFGNAVSLAAMIARNRSN